MVAGCPEWFQKHRAMLLMKSALSISVVRDLHSTMPGAFKVMSRSGELFELSVILREQSKRSRGEGGQQVDTFIKHVFILVIKPN